MNKLLIKEICCMDPVQRTTWKIQSKALQRGRGGEGGGADPSSIHLPKQAFHRLRNFIAKLVQKDD